MYWFRKALVLVMALQGVLLYAQDQVVKGKVVTADGVPLYGVYVYQKNGAAALSNEQGDFALPVSNGNVVVLQLLGFETREWAPADVPQEVVMHEMITRLAEVRVGGASMIGGAQGTFRLPGSATYLGPRELARFEFSDLNQTLKQVPGVNIQEEDGFGLRPNIGLRGTGVERSSKITLMEDGVLIAPAPYAASAAYYFPTAGRMHGIEVVKGSSQIAYGPFTTGGAVNLISTPIPSRFTGKFQLQGGSFGQRQVHAHVGDTRNGWGYLIETFQYGADGFKTLPLGGETGFDKRDYVFKLAKEFGSAENKHRIQIKAGLVNELSHETYLGLAQADYDQDPFQRYAGSAQDQMKTQQNQWTLTHSWERGERFTWSTTAYRTDFHRNWYKLDKVVDSTGTKIGVASMLDNPMATPFAYDVVRGAQDANNALVVKANNRTYYAQGVQSVAKWSWGANWKYNVQTGIRLHQDEADRFQWEDEYSMFGGAMQLATLGTPGTESNRIEGATALAGFAQAKIQKGKWSLLPGIRVEHIDQFRKDYGKSDPNRTGVSPAERSNQATVVLPGLGVSYSANANLEVFGGLHRGFSPQGNNPGSQPELSWNSELGTRYRNNGLWAEGVLFYTNYTNLQGADLAAAGGGGSTDLFNGGAAVTYGIELQAGWDVLPQASSWHLPLTMAYTYTHGQFLSSFNSEFEGWNTVQSGDELPYLAPHQLQLGASLEHRLVQINLQGRYASAMRTVAGAGELQELLSTDEVMTLDASVRYRLSPAANVMFRVANLTDATYVVARRPAGMRPAMPRSFVLGFTAWF